MTTAVQQQITNGQQRGREYEENSDHHGSLRCSQSLEQLQQ